MKEYHQIREKCRKGLLRHLEIACRKIPGSGNPEVLDIGCGTGVPTIWLAEHFPGHITAIDTDEEAIDFLKIKIQDGNLENRIEALHLSFFDFIPETKSFDVILAEGFLNVVGFEAGFKRMLEILTSEGHFIIHDEYRNHDDKCKFIVKNYCKIIDTLYLDEGIWWDDYYQLLEAAIEEISNDKLRKLFASDIKEIEAYKKDPSPFRSMYYIGIKL